MEETTQENLNKPGGLMPQAASSEAVPPSPPAIMGGTSNIAGLEDMDADDIRIPRVKLLQGSSREIKNPVEYPNLRTGMLINSITHDELDGQVDGSKKLYPFVPVKMFKSWQRFNAYGPGQNGWDEHYKPGELIFRVYDRNDPLTKTEDAWKYKCINFLGFQPSTSPQPIVVTFASTSRPIGQSMIDCIRLAGRNVWEHVFMLGSQMEGDDANSYMAFTAKSAGKPDDAIVQLGAQMYNEFNPILADMKKHNVKIDEGHGDVQGGDTATPPWNK